MNYIFDGENLIITPVTGLRDLDAKILYSEWKEWIASGDNSKWPAAFDVVGGDELSPGINAGSYFFLRNDAGWRIRPAEEDATVYVYGNLVPRDSSLPLLIPTTGQHQVLFASLQPVTQSVEQLLTSQQKTSYNGGVYVDVFDGVVGTSYPVGTAATPVNNWTQAKSIASGYGFGDFHVHGPIVFDSGEDISNLSFFSDSSAVSSLKFIDNNVGGSSFVGFTISGRIEPANGRAFFRECFIRDLDEINGDLKECVLDGILHFETGTHTLAFCSAYNYPIIDLGGYSGINMIFRNWAGPLELRSGYYDANSFVMDSFSSHIIFDASFEKGNVTIYGIGQYTNNSTGSFQPATSLLKAPQIDTIEAKVDNLTAISL